MNTRPQRLSLSLPKKAIFTLPDAHDVDIECQAGSLWITLDPWEPERTTAPVAAPAAPAARGRDGLQVGYADGRLQLRGSF